MDRGKYPLRSREEAFRIVRQVERMACRNYIRIDGFQVAGVPSVGVIIKNSNIEERITWDSFRELWLRNVECDEPFVTKPFLARQ